jgi:hypothetical protein
MANTLAYFVWPSLTKMKTFDNIDFSSLYHRFERYNLGLASIGNTLETVGSYTNN